MAAMAIRVVAARATRSPAAFTRGFKIYTRTGDAGSSSLFNGERRSKDHEVFEALGDSDELNAAIGLARAHCETQSASGTSLHDIMTQLDTVQSRLLDVGSAVATSADTPAWSLPTGYACQPPACGTYQRRRAAWYVRGMRISLGRTVPCVPCTAAPQGANQRAVLPQVATPRSSSNEKQLARVRRHLAPCPNPDPNPDPNPSPAKWATTLP